MVRGISLPDWLLLQGTAGRLVWSIEPIQLVTEDCLEDARSGSCRRFLSCAIKEPSANISRLCQIFLPVRLDDASDCLVAWPPPKKTVAAGQQNAVAASSGT
eukprot:132747-Chlamydomonas_euryale.AAC.2